MTGLYLADHGAPDDSAESPHSDACGGCCACLAAEEAPGLHARAAAGDDEAVVAMWERWEAGV